MTWNKVFWLFLTLLTRTVGATELTRDAGRTDGQADGRTEWNQYTPNNFVVRGFNKAPTEYVSVIRDTESTRGY